MLLNALLLTISVWYCLIFTSPLDKVGMWNVSVHRLTFPSQLTCLQHVESACFCKTGNNIPFGCFFKPLRPSCCLIMIYNFPPPLPPANGSEGLMLSTAHDCGEEFHWCRGWNSAARWWSTLLNSFQVFLQLQRVCFQCDCNLNFFFPFRRLEGKKRLIQISTGDWERERGSFSSQYS